MKNKIKVIAGFIGIWAALASVNTTLATDNSFNTVSTENVTSSYNNTTSSQTKNSRTKQDDLLDEFERYSTNFFKSLDRLKQPEKSCEEYMDKFWDCFKKNGFEHIVNLSGKYKFYCNSGRIFYDLREKLEEFCNKFKEYFKTEDGKQIRNVAVEQLKLKYYQCVNYFKVEIEIIKNNIGIPTDSDDNEFKCLLEEDILTQDVKENSKKFFKFLDKFKQLEKNNEEKDVIEKAFAKIVNISGIYAYSKVYSNKTKSIGNRLKRELMKFYTEFADYLKTKNGEKIIYIVNKNSKSEADKNFVEFFRTGIETIENNMEILNSNYYQNLKKSENVVEEKKIGGMQKGKKVQKVNKHNDLYDDLEESEIVAEKKKIGGMQKGKKVQKVHKYDDLKKNKAVKKELINRINALKGCISYQEFAEIKQIKDKLERNAIIKPNELSNYLKMVEKYEEKVKNSGLSGIKISKIVEEKKIGGMQNGKKVQLVHEYDSLKRSKIRKM